MGDVPRGTLSSVLVPRGTTTNKFEVTKWRQIISNQD